MFHGIGILVVQNLRGLLRRSARVYSGRDPLLVQDSTVPGTVPGTGTRTVPVVHVAQTPHANRPVLCLFSPMVVRPSCRTLVVVVVVVLICPLEVSYIA